MCIVSPTQPQAIPAALLPPDARQQIALAALGGLSISGIAADHDVSRKFVYRQLDRAQQGIDSAFAPSVPDQKVLFHLPVTKSWLRQLVLSLVLTCHSSLRGVRELLADVFDYSLSLGSIHNIVQQAVDPARAVNDRQNLSGVRIGAHDEIFQAGRPVLVGVDTHSTYCYLLSLEDHRDAGTWGVRLLELADRGFDPEATIADAAGGLRAGQEQALPEVPCRGDVFHCLYEVGPLVRYLENRAYDAMNAVEKLKRQQKRHHRSKGRKNLSVVRRLHLAERAEAKAITLADDVATLARWLQGDILAVAGPDHETRLRLLDLVVAELALREPQCEHRIRPVRSMLANQGKDLLAFAEQLDEDLRTLAEQWQVNEPTVRELLQTQQMAEKDPRRWQREALLRQRLRGRYHALSEAVGELSAGVVRASSLVENVNSRLRSYFFLRRQLGPDYLELLRFYLNHRRFPRSEQGYRVGKSPAELLNKDSHAHWLELLGYQRFSRN
jgi:hypothetical protein